MRKTTERCFGKSVQHVGLGWGGVLAICLAASSVEATDFYKANSLLSLTNAASWTNNTGNPFTGGANTLIWNNLVSADYCTNNIEGAANNHANITIRDPGADVVITNGSGSLWPGNIDMSTSSSRGLAIVGYKVYWQSQISTVNVANARTLVLPEVVNRASSTTTIYGAGTLVWTGANWSVGSGGGGTSVVNLVNGVLTNAANNALGLGTGSGCSGFFNQSGGDAYLYQLVVGYDASSQLGGRYSLTAGKLSLRDIMVVAAKDNASMFADVFVSGGQIASSGPLYLFGITNTSRYVQSGASTASFSALRIASAAVSPASGVSAVGTTASLVISNGIFYATNFENFASAAGTTGTIWLAGGTTTLPAFPTTRGSGAYADITFDGGTLVPNTNNCSTYLQGLNHAYLTANGAFLDTAGNSVTVSQVLENATSQTGKLTKSGAGTLTLAGANTYSGNTTVSNGVLKIAGSGSISNSPVVNVAVSSATCDVSAVSGGWTVLSNQTLTGLGVVTGTVVTVVSNGVVAPGASGVAGGTLTINGTNTFLNGAKLNLDYNGATIDALAVNGVLNLPSNMTLTLSGSGRFSKVNVMNCTALAMSSTNFSGWTINGGPSGVRAVYDNAGHVQLVSPTGGIIMLQ